jgi:ABC-type antimicrobial peptide transport system permease subunit
MEKFSMGGFSLTETCYISYAGLNETFPQYNENATIFFLDANSDHDVEVVESRVKAEFGDEYEMLVLTYQDVVARQQALINNLFIAFDVISVFAIVNSGIGVLAIVMMNISERKREIGILRSQGFSRAQVIVSVLGEALIFGVIGFVTSVILGLVLELVTLSVMVSMGFPSHALVIPYSDIRNSLFFAIGISVAGSMFPAWYSTRIKIVDALRLT